MASHWKWHRGSQQYSLIWKYKQKSALRFSSEITSATRFSDHLLCHKNKTESNTSSMSVAWLMRMKSTSSKWSLNYGTWPLANFSFIGQIAINIVLRYVFILNDVMFMYLCVGLCTWVLWWPCGDLKRALDTLGLELLIVQSRPTWLLGRKLRLSARGLS